MVVFAEVKISLYVIFFFFLSNNFCSHDGDDKKRPVIIHRAILGSVERMIAILTENYGGKWFVNNQFKKVDLWSSTILDFDIFGLLLFFQTVRMISWLMG